MKYLDYLTWISGILAGFVMLLGLIDLFFEAELFPVNHVVNYFHVASCLLLVSICCTLYLIWMKLKQKED